MRKFNQLKGLKKVKRIWFSIGTFFRLIFHRINTFIWKIKYLTTHRYHIINIKGEDSYTGGWLDRDHVMFLACFKILRDFVEKEDPTVGLRTLDDYLCKCDDPECCPHNNDRNFMLESTKAQVEREKEVRTLYDWWTKGRAAEHAECDRLMDKFGISPGLGVSDEKAFKVWAKRDEELHEKDEEMLLRLIKIRRCLWT